MRNGLQPSQVAGNDVASYGITHHQQQQQYQHQWSLQIKNLDRNTDTGIYQCQLNTDPPQSQYYQLNIVEPQVTILGAPDYTIKLGSMLNLSCVISQSPDLFQYIFWHKDNRVINFELDQQNRGRVVLFKLANKLHTTVSNMIIDSVRQSDSGNYSCRLSGVAPATIQVHVLENGNGFDSRGSMMAMFQNDDQQHLSQATTSGQLGRLSAHNGAHSSASSKHSQLIRITANRLLALALSFLIIQSWLQVVLQIQTAISLFLLAIIGWFIGKLTEKPLRFKHPDDKHEVAGEELKYYNKHNESTLLDKKHRSSSEENSHHNINGLHDHCKSGDNNNSDNNIYGNQKYIDEMQRQQQQQHQNLQLNSTCRSERELVCSLNINNDKSIITSDIESSLGPTTPLLVDPILLRRANSALNLLRTLAAQQSEVTLRSTTTTLQRGQYETSTTTSQPMSHNNATSGLECWTDRVGSGASSTTSGAPSTNGGLRSGHGDQSSGHHSLDVSDERQSTTEPIELNCHRDISFETDNNQNDDHSPTSQQDLPSSDDGHFESLDLTTTTNDIHRIVSNSRSKSVRLIPFRGTSTNNNNNKSKLFNNDDIIDKSCIAQCQQQLHEFTTHDTDELTSNEENVERRMLLQIIKNNKGKINQKDCQISDSDVNNDQDVSKTGDMDIELAADQPTALSLLMDRLTLADDDDHKQQPLSNQREPHYISPARSNNKLNYTKNLTTYSSRGSLRR